MDILIIGGTAFFGRGIVELALAAGHKVTVFSRGRQRPAFWDRIEHIAGDRSSQTNFADKLKGRQFDVVVDNIAYNGDDVRAALDIFGGNVGRYVLTSSAAVYLGLSNLTLPIAEDEADFNVKSHHFPGAQTPTPQAFLDYALGKISAERVLLEQNDIPYTVVRPPTVVGPEDPTGRCQFYFQRLLDGGPLILTNGGIQIQQVIYSRDLAGGYLVAMGCDKAVNQVYHLADEKATPLVDWVRLAARLLGVEANIVNIPAEVLHQSHFTYKEPWTRTNSLILDLSKIRADLAFKSTPIEVWLAKTTRWYRDTLDESKPAIDSNRQAEIAFAEKYGQLTAEL